MLGDSLQSITLNPYVIPKWGEKGDNKFCIANGMEKNTTNDRLPLPHVQARGLLPR